MKNTFVMLCLGAILLIHVVAASQCKSKETCSSCIQTPNCMWCRKPGNFSSSTSSFMRCKERQGQIDEWRDACGIDNIEDPENLLNIHENIALTEAGILSTDFSSSGSSQGFEQRVIQMKPQNVGMSLRMLESHSTIITFRQAEDYPVDLYYLMDLSQSMADDKESLSRLGQQLAAEMQNITKNFRLGFGSFVDKVVMPYVSTVPEKLKQPCDNCAPPYGFKNALSLTIDADKFVHEVDRAPVSGNLDAPEGGFDAIMQAIKCKKEIGWRESARHLLLFTTDAGFHYAGDGKLGGIVKPNDGKCHLDSKGYYTYSSILDYPSVSQINQVVKEENINIIFAVTSEQASVYKKLAYMIEGSSAGELAANSDNIVDLVKKEYNKITSKIQLKDNAQSPVTIRYFSRCKDAKGPEIETSVCDQLRVGDEVEFRMEITIDECPKDPSLWKQMIEISPVALPDKLIIDLTMLCDCQCERTENNVEFLKSLECSGEGTYQCGICACPEDFRGRKCECGPDTPFGSGLMDDTGCRADNYSKICSGQGTCNCGECKCNLRDNHNEIIDSQFCECTNFLCEFNNGKICSGVDHGVCKCDKCDCKPGWIGDACQCRNSTDNCRNPDTNDICSGNGDCECNQCKCSSTKGGRFSGKYCEDCPLCHNEFSCSDFTYCVQCRVFDTGPHSEDSEFCDQCSILYSNYTGRIAANYTINVTDYVQRSDVDKGEQFCSYFDEDDCQFKFIYFYDENREPVVRVQRTLECPPKLDILGVVLGVIGAIVGLGLLLLVMWKFLTTIHDRREYARFEKERMMAKWDTGENPIYQQATSTFKNPIYSGK